jgi:hypothetical protein
MPNWCLNRVRIRAKKETLEKIKATLKGVEYARPFNFEKGSEGELVGSETLFSFHNIIPQPDETLDRDDPRRVNKSLTSDQLLDALSKKEGVMPDWWHWRVNNWGTKWSVVDVDLVEKKGCIVYSFDTAWAPPEPVLTRLSEMFPDANILLSFYEPGCIGRGSVTYKDGEVIAYTGVGAE